MEFANAIIAFTGISFLVYGFNSLFSKRMINEFDRWGFSQYRKIISVLQILGAIGLILGLKFNIILIASSLGLSIMMFFAIIVRIKINDNISRILPAITYFVLNALILNYSLQALN